MWDFQELRDAHLDCLGVVEFRPEERCPNVRDEGRVHVGVYQDQGSLLEGLGKSQLEKHIAGHAAVDDRDHDIRTADGLLKDVRQPAPRHDDLIGGKRLDPLALQNPPDAARVRREGSGDKRGSSWLVPLFWLCGCSCHLSTSLGVLPCFIIANARAAAPGPTLYPDLLPTWEVCRDRQLVTFVRMCGRPTRTLRASVRHTDAFSGVVQRDATIHQSIAAKVATGFELGNSLDKNELQPLVAPPSRIRLAVWTGLTEPQNRRKVLVLNEKQPTANQCDGQFLFQVGARGFEPPISKCVVCQTLFLVSKTARKNQEQSLTPSLSRTKSDTITLTKSDTITLTITLRPPHQGRAIPGCPSGLRPG